MKDNLDFATFHKKTSRSDFRRRREVLSRKDGGNDYGAAVTWARRLRCQQSSVLSVQIGRSLP